MNKITTSITALALTAAFSLAAIAPASADQAAATRNEILGGVALIAGIATAINVSNKNAEANAQYGYYDNNAYAGGDNRSYQPAYNGRSYQPAYNNRSNQNRSNNEQRTDRRWTQDRR